MAIGVKKERKDKKKLPEEKIGVITQKVKKKSGEERKKERTENIWRKWQKNEEGEISNEKPCLFLKWQCNQKTKLVLSF